MKDIQKQPVYTADGATLPEEVANVISLEPKFAVVPKKSAPELLSLFRNASRLVGEEGAENFCSDGVDVLVRCKPAGPKLPVKHVA